jgi:tetratricopeptide (TPR) repeat protein
MEKFQQGKMLFKEGKFENALAIFNDLIAIDPLRAEYILYRGRILSRIGRTLEALEDFDQLIALEPLNADFISDRAVVLHMLQRNQESLSELNRALTMEPHNPYRYSSRAFLKDRMGDLKGAIADYEKAIEIDPEDAIAHNNKGMVEEKLGYQDKSRESFKRADDLVGYNKPDQSGLGRENQTHEIPSELKDQGQTRDEKITLSSYWNTLTDVIKNPDTRADFFKFVSDKFKNK